jgi:hypothetical protein
MVDVEDQYHHGRYPREDQKYFVLVIESLCALERCHQCPRYSPNRRDDEKDAQMHGCETQDIAEGVLRKSWYQKEEKAQYCTLVSDQIPREKSRQLLKALDIRMLMILPHREVQVVTRKNYQNGVKRLKITCIMVRTALFH